MKTSHYLPALDGLRGLSIILVLIAHLGFSQVPGGFGVNVFFYISGFLITNLLLAEHAKKGNIDLKNFFIRRILRLYPPLILMVLIASIAPPLNKNANLPEILAALFYFENYYYIHNFYDFYHKIQKANFRIIWSLSIEEHFYLVFPFLFAFLVKNKKVLISVTGLIILGALLLRMYIAMIYGANAYSDNYTYSATLCRADAIMMGCLSSILIYIDKKGIYVKVASFIPVFLFALVLIVHSLIYRDEFYRQTYRYTLQSAAFMSLIPAILYGARYSILNKLLSIRPLVFVGKLSYSLYLFHPIVYGMVYYFVTKDKQSPLYWVTSVACAFGAACLSYFLVERPLMSLRRKYGSVAGEDTEQNGTVQTDQQSALAKS